MILGHRVRGDQGRQVEVGSIRADRAEVLPEASHAARDALQLPLELQQRNVIELHNGHLRVAEQQAQLEMPPCCSPLLHCSDIRPEKRRP
jgi:hypothetical protein